MLVLTRKSGEQIVIGDNVIVTIISNDKGKVKVGIDAPSDVRILRKELLNVQSTDRVCDTQDILAASH
jgi:carbon storage regulator CsrA